MNGLPAGLVSFQVGAATMLAPDIAEDHLNILYGAGVWYESDLLAAIQSLRGGGVFVDIGAGFGNHSVFFALECGADKVIAVEPYPGSFAVLEENIRNNDLGDVVDARRALIHPTWESATMSPAEGDQLPEMWSWRTQPALSEGGDLPCVSLDRLLADVDVDVIKIDVEESGPAVLGSGMRMLARCKPLVAIEAEPAEQSEVDELLESLGYRCLGRYCATPTFLWQAA